MGSLKRKDEPEEDHIALKATGFHAIMYHGILVLTILIFLQSIKETIYSVYYFNLVALGFTPSVLVLLIFLAPLLTGPLTRKIGWRTMFIAAGAFMASSRLPMGFGLEQPFHLFFSALALVSSSIMVSLFFALGRREKEVDGEIFSSQSATASIVAAMMMMIIFRIGGSGLDISIVPKAMGFILSPLFSGLISLGLGFMVYCIRESPILDDERGEDGEPGYTISGGVADSKAPILGFAGFLIVSLAIITDPHVVTAWTGEEFYIAASFTIFAMGLFILSLLSGVSILISLRKTFANPLGAIIGNAIMIGGAFNLFYMGVDLKFIPGPFVWIALVDLWVIIDAIVDPSPFAGDPVEVEHDGVKKVFGFPNKKKEKRSPDHFGKIVMAGVGLTFLFIVLISMALNWSFVPLGTLFKGSIPVVMMGGVTILALAGFSCSKGNIPEPSLIKRHGLDLTSGSPTAAAGKGTANIGGSTGESKRMRDLFLTLDTLALAFVLVSGGMSVLVQAGDIDETGLDIGDTLTVATFNIHHGYSNDGRVDMSAHLELLEDIDPDIVFLQEADSVLLNQGNFDPGLHLADKMDMHYFRGSKPGLGNPGTAILSRFPIEEMEVVEIRSDSIQRIIVTCVADLGSMKVGLIGLHFGLEEDEREKQMEDLLQVISTMSNMSLIIGGDFNTQPFEEMMTPLNPSQLGNSNLSVGTVNYSFSSGWHSTERGERDPLHPTYPAKGLKEKKEHIDYLLFSPDFTILDAGIEDGEKASDHRPVWTKVAI